MKEEKVRLLFVCLGNICRSPSAEAVMKRLVKDAGLGDRIEIDSAGIAVGDMCWIRSPVRYVSGTSMTSI